MQAEISIEKIFGTHLYTLEFLYSHFLFIEQIQA